MSFHIDTKAVQALAQKLTNAQPIIRDEMLTGMRRSMTQIEADAKRDVPVDTHALQRSITHTVTQGNGGVVGIIGAHTPYARAIEEGRPAIVIRPKKGKYLVFEIGGQTIFAREVNQPARAARPYLKTAITKNRAAIQREFGQAVPQRIARRLGLS